MYVSGYVVIKLLWPNVPHDDTVRLMIIFVQCTAENTHTTDRVSLGVELNTNPPTGAQSIMARRESFNSNQKAGDIRSVIIGRQL